MIAKQLNIEEKVGLYIRISRNDGREGDSLSIENQRHFLENYAINNGFLNYEFYIDDGVTGLTFDRPSFNKLTGDIENGLINIVIVKDLSRIGRNQTKFVEFVDEFLPSKNCRLIAVNDYIDTINDDNEVMPLKSLFNEFYSKDLSKKVKVGKRISATNGNFIGGKPPYGYIRNANDRSKLEIDTEVTDIIKRIYDMRLQKYGYAKIAKVLNDENITPPLQRFYQTINKDVPNKKHANWGDAAVKRVLTNEVYIGTLVSFKYTTTSLKQKNVVIKDEDEWIKVENAHEPIISTEMWQKVQEINKNQTANCKSLEDRRPLPIFTGLLRCSDCGCSLNAGMTRYKRLDGTRANKITYKCKTHHATGKSVCSPHRITEIDLIEIIKTDLNEKLKRSKAKEKSILEKVKYSKKKLELKQNTDIEKHKKTIITDLEMLENEIFLAYENKALGNISKEKYEQTIKDIELSIKNKKIELEKASQISEIISTSEDYKAITKQIRSYLKFKHLDREIVRNLIENIVIYENTEIDGENQQKIEISYKFKL